MLIIPLHQRLSLDRFPWVTALLIVVNVLVYFGIQSRDGPAFERAAEFYQRSQLLSVEWPRLLQYLQDNGRENLVPQLQRMPAAQQAMAAVQLQAHDTGISAELMRQPPVDNHDQAGLERWHRDRERLEALLEGAVTPRHSLHYHQPSLGGLLSSMFLHGDAGHLFGNMLFLGLLGLMTELALGPWLFLSVYLLAGVGGGLFSLVRHLGEVGSALGASGAIAGLMGACCVVWGLRKIRVFYWFFIIFDYVRVPALWLLPFWLGWELWQMLASPDAGIAFDAHAGGIMTGALASFAIRKLGWERREVMDESEVEELGALGAAMGIPAEVVESFTQALSGEAAPSADRLAAARATLGVEADATPAELQQRYQQLQMEAVQLEDADTRMERIQDLAEAYQVVMAA